jgi:hypothetical protein
MNRCQNQGPSNVLGRIQRKPVYRLDGNRRIDGMSFEQAVVRNMGTCRPDAKGAFQVGGPYKKLSTDAGHRGGLARSSDEGPVMGVERRGQHIQQRDDVNCA